jgi:hypothetical protein
VGGLVAVYCAEIPEMGMEISFRLTSGLSRSRLHPLSKLA